MCCPSYNLSQNKALYNSIQKKKHIFDMKFNHPLNVANQYKLIPTQRTSLSSLLLLCRCCLLLCMRNMCIFIHCHKNRPTKKIRKNIFIINEFIYNMFLFYFFLLFRCSPFPFSSLIPPFNNIFNSPSPSPSFLYVQMYSPFSVCVMV